MVDLTKNKGPSHMAEGGQHLRNRPPLLPTDAKVGEKRKQTETKWVRHNRDSKFLVAQMHGLTSQTKHYVPCHENILGTMFFRHITC